MTDEYILTHRTQSVGREGRTLYRFRWTRVSDGQQFETTVDDSYRNWSRCGWNQLAQDPTPWRVYQNLTPIDRKTTQGYGVITADNRPQPIPGTDCTQQEAQAMSLAARGPLTTYDDLFQQV